VESGLRKHVWESMLIADMNHRYYQLLTDHHRRIDLIAKILVALTSSAAVSGWAIWGRPGLDWMWKAASAASAVVAVGLPIVDPAKSMRSASELSASWFEVLREYELVWAEVDEASEKKVRGLCKKLATEEKRLAQVEANLAINNRLARRSENAMRAARDYTLEQEGANHARSDSKSATHPTATVDSEAPAG
jgi:hypothetical protein